MHRQQKIARYFKTHYGDIVQQGQVRHLPGGIYWEQGCERDQYQNGAYRAPPVGWFVYTLDLVDPDLADQTVIDMITHFRQYGACEWIIGETQKLRMKYNPPVIRFTIKDIAIMNHLPIESQWIRLCQCYRTRYKAGENP